MQYFLFLVTLFLSASTVFASSECTVKSDQRRNADGSQLRITQKQCLDNDSRTIRIELKPQSKSAYRTVLLRTQSVAQLKTGGGSLQDIDGDGMYEYVEIGSCGAGPNCRHEIFKMDQKERKAYLFFDGGYFDFRMISGLYVVSGRSSCCSWEYQIYRKPINERTISEQDLLYRITIKKGSVDSPSAQCFITNKIGSQWFPIDLKDKQLLKLCELYGESYVLNPTDVMEKQNLSFLEEN